MAMNGLICQKYPIVNYPLLTNKQEGGCMSILNDYRQYSGDIEQFEQWMQELKREYRREEMERETDYEYISSSSEDDSDYA